MLHISAVRKKKKDWAHWFHTVLEIENGLKTIPVTSPVYVLFRTLILSIYKCIKINCINMLLKISVSSVSIFFKSRRQK